MKIIAKKDRTPQLIDKLLKVWENSVRATHKFLSNEEILEIKSRFEEAINDDLNMPSAMGVVWETIRCPKKSRKIAELLLKFDEVLGIKMDEKPEKEVDIPEEIMKLVEERNQARKDKNWELSDKLRDIIKEKGYTVIDAKDGTKLEHN